MFEISRILPLFTFWTLILFLSFLLIKYHLIPIWIGEIVQKAPLDADALLQRLELKEMNQDGLLIGLKTIVKDTKLPLGLFVTIKIPCIRVFNQTGQLVAILKLSDAIRLGQKDVELEQLITVDLCQSVYGLKPIIKRMSIIGNKELDRLSFKIDFFMTISIMDYLVFERIPCSKILRIHDFQKNSKPFNHQYLLPNPRVTPFAHPRLKSIEAGLRIEFETPPGFTFTFNKVSFRALLNGSSVADVVITGLSFSNKTSCHVVFEITPMNGRVLTSPFHLSKGIVKGAISGIANGLLSGDWGGQCLVLGLKQLSFENEMGEKIWWLDDLFQGIELEHDLDAVRKVRQKLDQKTEDFGDALSGMVMMILAQSQCPVM